MAPAAPRLIDRGDLVAALDRAAASKVTVISAPAGSGKTSLLRAWARRQGQARHDEARARLTALEGERARSGEVRNASAVVSLAEGDPAGAAAAVADVLDGTAPVLGYATVVEAHLIAGLAQRELGDQRAASQAAERALAESDRLVLPFAMTDSAGLLEALPPHQTAHGALLADILDILHGSSPAALEQSALPLAEELSPGELRVLRYLPTKRGNVADHPPGPSAA